MPFYKDFTDENATILFWKYNENVDFFVDEELVQPEDKEKIKDYHPKKKIEYLMIRQMLKTLMPEHKILYRSVGQPYLFPKDAFISITHSYPFASIAISQKRVGIDLEKFMPKILRIKHKFVNENEAVWTQNGNEIELITIIWVIKEALYKLHPSKYWSLKKHYEVSEFELGDLSNIRCRIFDDHFEDYYFARVFKIEDFYFAIIEENHKIHYFH